MSISSISGLLSGYNSSSSLADSKVSSVVSSGLLKNLDANHDKAWSYDEVSNYASKYKELTGNELDVSDIYKTYDKDGSNSLSAAEQAAVLNNDALGLDEIKTNDTSADSSIMDTIASSEPASADSLFLSSLTQESDSSLISQMFGSKSSDKELLSGVFGATSAAAAAKAYWALKSSAPKNSVTIDTLV